MKSKIIALIKFFKKIIQFFEKDAFLVVNYDIDFKDGEVQKTKSSFSIYICQFGKCRTTFTSIDWNEAPKLLETLENAKRHVLVTLHLSNMAKSHLFIPNWAKKPLIQQLKAELE